jgi:hypothetical protein
LRVDVRDGSFVIDYVNPEVAYLPYYNPVVVYGTWWWPTHQPVYWAPWPGYYTRAGFHGYVWGPPVRVSRGFFYSAPDWRHRRVNIVNVNNYYYRAPNAYRADAPRNPVANAPHVWQHDAAHRRDVPRRDANWRQPAPRVEGNARIEPVPPQRMQSGARVEVVPAAAPAPRVNSATDSRRDWRDRGATGTQNRGAPGNGPSAVAPAPPEARVAPGAPAASTQPTVAAPAAPAAAVTRSEPPRTAESRGREARGSDGRAYEQRSERTQRNDARFDSNRTADRANQQPQSPAVAAPAARAPVSAPTPPVAAAPAVVNQSRAAPAPMPVPTAPPVAAGRPPVEAKPAVAAAPRAPENQGRRGDPRQGQHERAQPASNDNTVAAVPPGNGQGPQGQGNARGNGNGNRQRE